MERSCEVEDHLRVHFGDYSRYSSLKSLDQHSLISQIYFIYTSLVYHLSAVLIVSPNLLFQFDCRWFVFFL